MISRILSAFVAVVLAWVSLPAFADGRYALVIGNDTYQSVPSLLKARNDAQSVHDALSGVGFDSTLVLDGDQLTLLSALSAFANKIKPGDETVFYFAGHGIEIDGSNYLLPTDVPEVRPGLELVMTQRALQVETVVDTLRQKGARVSLLIIDACRDNPFPKEGTRSIGATRGLGRVTAPEGTFLMFSAGAGQTALDRLSGDDGNPNSVFTRVLLPRLVEPGLPIHELAREVRTEVRKLAQSVNHDQFPAVYDEFDGELALVPASLEGRSLKVEPVPQAQAQSAQVADPCSAARADWAIVAQTESKAALEGFVATHAVCPILTALATERLAALQAAGGKELASLSTLTKDVVAADARTGELKQCQELADPATVSFDDLVAGDINRTIDICRRALSSEPEGGRAAALLGRVLSASGQVEEAFTVTKQGADAGDAFAMNNLAVMYEQGQGVTRNDFDAVRWYQAAAEAGSSVAMANLGWMYEAGKGVGQSDTEAARWYRAAADAGNGRGAGNLGWMYENGRGVEQSQTEAAHWYQVGSDLGDARSMQALGWMYENGVGVAQDDTRAVEYFHKAADAGNTRALVSLGWHYENGRGVTQDDVQAVSFYQKAADQGDSEAMGNLAWMYENGRGVTQNYDEAVRLYRAGHEAGNARSTVALGWFYEMGMGGLAPDEFEAARLYKIGAEAGNPAGLGNIAWMYENGRGVEQSYEEAVRWYTKGYEANDARSATALGWYYENGVGGVAQSDTEAVRLYRIGAEGGNLTGMSNLGWMYEAGRGVTQDYAEAMRWYQKGADRGDAVAQRRIGWLYENGLGVSQNDSEAFKWYRMGAEGGDIYAMNNLGVFHELGRGTTADYGEAFRWYSAAADGGNSLANYNLGLLYENGRGVTRDFDRAAELYVQSLQGGEKLFLNNAQNSPRQVIRGVQRILRDQGYYSGAVDGAFGAKTREAMEKVAGLR